MAEKAKGYPGALASPQQVYELAEEYRKAAHYSLKLGLTGKPLTRAPFRLLAIHATELYLSALLLERGCGHNQIRGMQHDIWMRTELARAAGLPLRKRTADHLRSLSQNREYLITRYGPEQVATTSQLNRLTATLDEVAEKVSVLLSGTPKALSTTKLRTANSMPRHDQARQSRTA